DDLYCHLTVSFPMLAMGGTLAVPTMTGDEQLKIPAGTQTGARFKLRGKGMPNVSGRGHGDLYAIARVSVPKKLTREQKQLLEELAKTLPEERVEIGADGTEKPFFEKVKDIFG
ncbi:MAG TPA: DnaJ C-terminal domain-containing protein, partial [Vicinamibacterales bacterium]|nr:DnaJ C-terminal domain-containing protein [Vicinamibacterales bacterium]